MDDPATEGSVLVQVKVVMSEFATSHMADHVDEVMTVQVFKTILIRVVRVGATVEVHRRRILPTLLITSVLRNIQYTYNNESRGTYAITLLVIHKGGNSVAGIGMGAGLATNTDSGAAPAVLILGAGDGTSGHWHIERSGSSDGRREITEVVDGGMTSQWCSLYPLPVRTITGPKRTDHLVNSGSSPTSITEPHHFSVRLTNGVTSVLHTLSARPI